MIAAVLTMVAVWCLLSVVAGIGWAMFHDIARRDGLSARWLWALPILFTIGVLLDMMLR